MQRTLVQVVEEGTRTEVRKRLHLLGEGYQDNEVVQRNKGVVDHLVWVEVVEVESLLPLLAQQLLSSLLVVWQQESPGEQAAREQPFAHQLTLATCVF